MNIRTRLVAAMLFLFSASVFAVPFGSPDDLEGSARQNGPVPAPQNSSPAEETKWINSVLGAGSVEDYFKWNMGASGVGSWGETTNYWTFEFKLDETLYEPDYFLVKIGTGKEGDTHWLFQNNPSENWAYIDKDDITESNNNTGMFSHVGLVYTGNGCAPGDCPRNVPEPGTLLLLALGLVGFGIRQRKAVIKTA